MSQRKTVPFVLALFCAAAVPAIAQVRSQIVAPGKTQLELEGKASVWMRTIQMPLGGGISGAAAGEARFDTHDVFDPVLIEWVNELFSGQARKRPGRTKFSNVVLKKYSHREFKDALLTEVSFPSANRNATTPAVLAIKFSAKFSPPRPLTAPAPSPAVMAKRWSPANFRFDLGDLPASRIHHMQPIIMRPGLSQMIVAEFYLPQSDAQVWQTRLAPGGPGIPGILEYLSPQGKVMATLSFQMARMQGLTAVPPMPGTSDPHVLARVTIGSLRLTVAP